MQAKIKAQKTVAPRTDKANIAKKVKSSMVFSFTCEPLPTLGRFLGFGFLLDLRTRSRRGCLDRSGGAALWLNLHKRRNKTYRF